MARDLYPGMGVAVAERTVLRRKIGGFESWQDVASRVAFGNSSLCANAEERISEYELLKNYIADGKLLTSGRHLQHGDISQQDRNGEVFSNCSTSISTFGLVYLLLNGSGVGRCYDDDLMLVDWDNAPNVLCVLDHRHPDFDYTIHETLRDAKHKYDGNRNVIWHAVEDSREGWANAVEYLETLAYQKVNRDKLLVLDFSNVRAKNSPIGGMQGRPSSGPVPLMNAFARVTSIKGAGMAPWKQAMYIDHYFAEVVLMGGVRRCLPKGTQVKVPTGHTPIENIKVGDEICTLKGTKKVTATFYQGTQDTVLIEHQFGTFECTGNHRVAVYRTSNSYEFIFAGSLKPGDRLVFDPTVCPGTKTELPPVPDKQKSRFDTNRVSWVLPELDTDIAWLLGILQGDGYIAISSEGKGSVSLKIASTYPEILKNTLNKLMLCFRKFGLIPTVADYRPEEDAVGIRVFSTSFARYLQSWLKKPNTDMQVPDCVSRGNPEIRWAYLSGLFDADGSSRTHPVSLLCSVYPGFVDSVMLCYQSLGVAVRSNWARRPNGWKDIAKISTKSMEHVLTLNTQFPKYSTKFKPSNQRFSRDCHTFPAYWNEFSIGEPRDNVCAFSLERRCKGLPVTVKSVTPSGRKVQTYDLEVADIHQFTANGLVVHNSARLAVKHWKDASILEYIQVKRPVEFLDKPAEEVQELRKFNPRSFLWSSNNSVGVDSEFWNLVHAKRNSKATKSELYRHAMRVFKMVTECAYYDGTGEPGFINLDQLVSNSANLDMIKGDYFQSNRYTLLEDTSLYLEKLLKIAKLKQFCMIANPCGEVPLSIWGGFCFIGDIVPYHCDTLEECEPVARAMTRFLIRTNKLDSVYSKEVKRTNRIGGALTGIQEFAAKFWGFNFFDLIDEQKSLPFWMTLSRMRRAIRDEAVKYCKVHNLPAPHTDVVIKPSGSVSKLFGLTEGWHLPAMPFYLRWVQFKDTDPLVEEYRSRGYPFRVLKTYKNSVIIGFPTSLEITKLLPPDRLVTASQATPEQQYKWLMLGEKYWIRGVDENGKPLSTDTGGQISYTLKYDPAVVSYKEFCDKIAEFQPKVKCCSVMPEVSNNGAYEYLPEEAITAEEFERIKSNIRESAVSEDVSYEHVDCAGGNCPVDFKTTK